MKRLLCALQRAWLQHQIRLLADDIDYEERHHKQHALRMDAWLREIAHKRGELAALDRGPVRLGAITTAGRVVRFEQPAAARFISPRRRAP